ncbi:MAG: nucleotidyl transferase AbiEii/AbiGii toxin family protein [Ignavibacteria bacterium]|nr:nucleotidyl transferase AbiEii/AbiGii toxin family protein [Ignavibacteria bacterium]
MLSLKEIEKFYPENQKIFKRNILREYLQYKILQIIFNNPVSKKLSLIGGTSLRIVFGTQRFSEDIDFDNFGLTEEEFSTLVNDVKRMMELDGYSIEIKSVLKKAYRCYIRIPKILYEHNLSGIKEEKILIQLDTEAQGFEYEKEKFLLNKFDIFTQIFITPKDVLLSQKLWAILNRKTLKGRDFYDAVFLFSITKPNYKYLEQKAKISNLEQLKESLYRRLKNENLNTLSKDVEPFLINKLDTNRITKFKDFIQSL